VADDLDAAVRAARFAMLDLIGLMAAHGLDFRTLGMLLDPGWPAPVQRAFTEWVTHMDDVAKALAARDGIPPGTRLTGKDRHVYTQRAFTAVMDG
jgi:hypothetical protein